MASEQQTVEINSVATALQELSPLLEDVQRNLEAFFDAGESGDPADLQTVTERLREVYGTLQFLEIHGAAILSGEMYALIEAVRADTVSSREQALEHLLKGVMRLSDYLARIRAGRKDIPAVLLPLINELRADQQRQALSEREVFFPDLGRDVMPVLRPIAGNSAGDAATKARELRPRFRRALLNWYRNHRVAASLTQLGEILSELAEVSATPSARRLWGICGALTEALADQGLEADNEVRRLMGRVERLLSRVSVEGERALEQRISFELLRGLLYHVARSGSTGERVQAIRETYDLAAAMGQQQGQTGFEGPDYNLLSVVADGIREDLAAVKDAVEIFVHSTSGSDETLAEIPQRLSRIADTFSMLGQQSAHDRLQQESELVGGLAEADSAEASRHLQELADTLVRLESDLDRMLAGSAPTMSDQEEPLAGLRQLPESEFRALVSGAVGAALEDLAKIREAIGTYCTAGGEEPQAVSDVPALLAEVRGAVAMMGLSRAERLLAGLREFVQRELVERTDVPDDEAQILIADVVAGIEYYLEAVDNDRAGMVHLLQAAERAVESLETGRPVVHDDDEAVVMATAADDEGATGEPTRAEDSGSAPSDEQAATEQAEGADTDAARALDTGDDWLGALAASDETQSRSTDTESPVEFAPSSATDSPDVDLEAAFEEWLRTEEPSVSPAEDDATLAEVDGTGEAGVEEGDQPASDELLTDSAEPASQDEQDLDLATALQDLEEEHAPATGHDDWGAGDRERAGSTQASAPPAEDSTTGPASEPQDTAAADTSSFADDMAELAAELGASGGQDEPTDATAKASDTVADASESPGLDGDPETESGRDASHESATTATAPSDELLDWEKELATFDQAADETGPAPAGGSDDWKSQQAAAIEAADSDVFASDEDSARDSDALLAEPDAEPAAAEPREGSDTTPDDRAALAEETAGADETAHAPAAAVAHASTSEQSEATTTETSSSQDSQWAILGDDVDEEIVEVYIEEALGELEKINEYLPRWKANRADEEALITVRRAFHTLKGGGRLIGAELIGEFSWSMENMLNRVIDHSIEAGPAVFETLEEGTTALPQLIEQIQGNRAPIAGIDELIARAHALSRGESGPPPGGGGGGVPAPDVGGGTGGSTVSETGSGASTRWQQGTARAPDAPSAASVATAITAEHGAVGAGSTTDTASVGAGSLPPEGHASAELPGDGYAEADTADDLASAGCNDHGGVATDPAALTDHATRPESPTLEVAEDDGDPATWQPVRSQTESDDGRARQSAAGKALSPASQQAPSATASDSAQDNTLLEIFAQEAAEHISVARDTLPEADADKAGEPVDESLLRALHTLHGSAQTAGAEAVVAVTAPMETLVRLRRDQGDDLTVEEVQLLRAGLDTLQRLVAALPELPPPEVEARLVGRLRSACDAVTADRASAGDDSELVEIFVDEADELVEACEHAIQTWRDDPQAVARVMIDLQRHLHTLKGGARMANITPIADLTHEIESMVNAINDGAMTIDNEVFELLQDAVDALTVLLEQARSGDSVARVDWLVDELRNRRLRETGPVETAGAEVAEPADGSAGKPGQPSAAPSGEETETPVANSGAGAAESGDGTTTSAKAEATPGSDQIRVQADLLDNLVNFAGEVSIYHSRLSEQLGQYKFNLSEFEQTVERLRQQLRDMENETESQILYRHEKEGESEPVREEFDPLEFDRYTRIQELSRSLAESVGDLGSIKEILDNLTRDAETLLLQQSRVSSDLQGGLMQTRMVRFDGLRARFNRTVRQTARSVGKQIELSMNGGDIEIDRSIQERIIGPLEHVLRNALTHGIESPHQRRRAGKPETGHLDIDLHRGGTDIMIEITDDGAGIDPAVIRRKAIERGLIAEDDPRDDNEIIQLILETGFSTADEVTQDAGRGVGMDVVDAEIRRLGGTLAIQTEKGVGTRFSIRLPVTLAINQAVMVKAGEESYAVPIASIEGVAQISGGELRERYIDPSKKVQYAGNEYELYHLGQLLGVSDARLNQPEVHYPVIMVRAGDQRVALHVDQLVGRREVVVKPLGAPLNTLPGISGATIMPDGAVVLILDVGGLLRTQGRIVETGGLSAAEQTREAAERDVAEAEEGTAATAAAEATPETDAAPTVLIVDDSITIRKVTQRTLARNGLQVATAKDGVDAVSWMTQNRPSLILLDIEMPRMDGYEVANYVRSESRLADIPIIMISSRTGEKHKQRAEDIGVNRYLGKPYQEGELMDAIREMIRVPETA